MYDKIMVWLVILSIIGLMLMGFGFLLDFVFEIATAIWNSAKRAVRKVRR